MSAPTRRPRRLLAGLLAALLFGLIGAPATRAQPLDETWTLTVNGRTVTVNPDGSYRIPNVPAPDQFGAGGPGSAPDFVGDDFVRVTGSGLKDGEVRYCFSEPFLISQGATTQVTELIFTASPPPLPTAIDLSIADTLLIPGETTPCTVIATLPDGSLSDVTPQSAWTTYRSSNPAICTVDPNGVITGQSTGTCLITASNDGATAVAQVAVTSASDPLTTIIGFVEFPDMSRATQASVSVVGLPVETTTDADGMFTLTEVPTKGFATYAVRASQVVEGTNFVATTTVEVVPDAELLDAGILVLEEAMAILVSGVRIDGQQQGEGVAEILNGLGYEAEFSATLPLDLSAYAMVWDADTTGAMSEAEEAQLIAYVQGGGALMLSGERPCCESANQSVEDIISALLGFNIQVGGFGDAGSDNSVNPAVIGGLATTPNALSSIPLCASGAIDPSVADENVFVRTPGNQIVSVAFDCSDLASGNGRVMILMDTDLEFPGGCGGDLVATTAMIENMTTFLLGACDG